MARWSPEDWETTGASPLSTSVDVMRNGTLPLDAGAEGAHRFSYNVNRTGDDYQTAGSRGDTGFGKRCGHIGRLIDLDGHAAGSLANLVRRGGARVLDVRGDHAIG